MPPLPSTSTACDIPEIHDHGCVDEMDMLGLPMFDDPLIWPPPRHGSSGSSALPLDLNGAAPLLQFAEPFSSARGSNESAQGRSKEPPVPQEPGMQLENALLLFSKPVMAATLLDELRRPVQLTMTAEIGGMFFVAEDIFNDEQAERPELTCYRRNLWQCLGDVALSQQPKYVLDEQGNEFAITQLMASVVAKESISGNPTDIVSTSWKTTDPVTGNALWAMGSPPVCPFTLPSNNTFYREPVGPSFKMAWTRLQFKHSTANNGRRKGPQQHYIVQVHLHAETDMGACLKVAEIHSSPVIVRGRSPRNFGSQKEIPISSVQRPDKRPFLDATAPADDEPGRAHTPSTSTPRQLPIQSPSSSQQPRTSRAPKRFAAAPETPASSSHAFAPPSIPSTADVLSLSLFDDNLGPADQEEVSPVPSAQDAPASSFDPEEDDDAYYEYFPLAADDWMPSIEAVYCPHVNHYRPFQDFHSIQRQGRSKRYFTVTK